MSLSSHWHGSAGNPPELESSPRHRLDGSTLSRPSKVLSNTVSASFSDDLAEFRRALAADPQQPRRKPRRENCAEPLENRCSPRHLPQPVLARNSKTRPTSSVAVREAPRGTDCSSPRQAHRLGLRDHQKDQAPSHHTGGRRPTGPVGTKDTHARNCISARVGCALRTSRTVHANACPRVRHMSTRAVPENNLGPERLDTNRSNKYMTQHVST